MYNCKRQQAEPAALARDLRYKWNRRDIWRDLFFTHQIWAFKLKVRKIDFLDQIIIIHIQTVGVTGLSTAVAAEFRPNDIPYNHPDI